MSKKDRSSSRSTANRLSITSNPKFNFTSPDNQTAIKFQKTFEAQEINSAQNIIKQREILIEMSKSTTSGGETSAPRKMIVFDQPDHSFALKPTKQRSRSREQISTEALAQHVQHTLSDSAN